MDVEQWTAGAFDCIADAIDTEVEVFHYHKAVIDTNYKLWHDTNSEFYHDFMHYFNGVSGFNDEYFRKNIPFDNGHVNVSSFTVNYEEYEGFEDRENYHSQTTTKSVVQPLSTSIVLSVRFKHYSNKVLIEFRGYGLKKDTPEERQTRIKHHNSI